MGEIVKVIGTLLIIQAAVAMQILHEADRVEDLPLHTYSHQQHSLTIGVDLVRKRAMLMSFEEGYVPESVPFQGKSRKILQQNCGYDPSGLIAIDCGTVTPTPTPTPTPSPSPTPQPLPRSLPSSPAPQEEATTEATESQIEFSEGADSSGSSAFVGNFVEKTVDFETIVRDDDRTRVENTQAYPYRTIGRLFFRCNGGGQACTATLIGPRTVITSAHCIYATSLGSACDSFEFAPGQQESFKPFGTVKATQIFYPAKYATSGGDTREDYGVLTLERDIGYEAGWMGFGYSCRNTVQDLKTAGYPNDKDPFSATMYEAECLQQDINACPCFDYVDPSVCPFAGQSNTFQHTCDTFRGQSGSPMWTEVSVGFPQIRGIHSSGFVQGAFVEKNTAVSIGQVVYKFSKDKISAQ